MLLLVFQRVTTHDEKGCEYIFFFFFLPFVVGVVMVGRGWFTGREIGRLVGGGGILKSGSSW